MKIGTITMMTCDYDTDILWVQPESNPIAIIKQKMNYNEVGNDQSAKLQFETVL